MRALPTLAIVAACCVCLDLAPALAQQPAPRTAPAPRAVPTTPDRNASAAQQRELTAAGLWEHVGSTGNPEAWFRISEQNGVYSGQIVKMFPKPGEDPTQWRCTKCEGARKDQPVLGITIIEGMQRNNRSYENGSILDPRDGTVYRALMELSPDGKQLTVRGYLGIALFGQSQVWTRLPDNAR